MKSFLKSGLIILKANLVTRFLNMFSLGLLSRILSIQNFGLYNIYINTGNSINQITELGITIPTQQKIAQCKKDNKEELGNFLGSIVLCVLIISFLFTFVLLILKNEIFKYLLSNNYDNYLVNIIIVITLFEYLNVFTTSVLFGLGNFTNIFKKNLFSYTTLLVLLIPIAYFYGFTYVFYSYALYSFITLIYSVYLIKNEIVLNGIKLGLNNFFKHLKNIFKNGIVYYIGSTLLGSITGLLTISLFSKYVNIIDFSNFRIASAIIALINFFPIGLASITISYLSQSDEYEAINLKKFQFRYIIFFTLFISIILNILLVPFISLLFGNQYLIGINYITYLIFLNFFTQTATIINNFLISSKKNNFVGLISIVHSLIIICTLKYFIFNYGFNGYLFINYFTTTLITILLIFKEFLTTNYKTEKYKIISFLILTYIVIFLILFIFNFIKIKFLFYTINLIVFILYFYIFYKYFITENEKKIFLLKIKIFNDKKLRFN